MLDAPGAVPEVLRLVATGAEEHCREIARDKLLSSGVPGEGAVLLTLYDEGRMQDDALVGEVEGSIELLTTEGDVEAVLSRY